MGPRGFRAVIAFSSLAVLALLVSAPWALPYGYVNGLSGHPGVIDFQYVWNDMDPFPAAAYWIGDVLCHQQAERSLSMNGSQMPICIRDLFIIAGFVTGCMVFLIRRYELDVRRTAILFAAAVSILLVDHTYQWLAGADIPLTRALTGAFVGVASAFLLELCIQVQERGTN
ncbi:MAG: DUF2085 domain-containing protein, partial [Candidatus Methanomethylophilaceae archaeon]